MSTERDSSASTGGAKTWRQGRRDPEKRRQQNREAQRTYRARRKHHIESLERMVAGALPPLAEGAEDPAGPVDAAQEDLTMSALPDSGQEELIRTLEFECSPNNQLVLASPSGFDDFLLQGTWPFDSDVIDLISSMNNTALTSCMLVPPPTSGNPPRCSCSPSHVQYPSTFNDTPSSNLRVEAICVVAAMNENCLELGITESMYCSSDSESPFFRPGISHSAHQARLVEAVRRIFHSVKPDLRPTPTQITHSHHPYIDIIPFPAIRDALIHRGADVDEDDFFHDCLGGLRCWGRAGSLQAGTAAPWDMRNWEASPWFLAKWRHVVGNEDGELSRQSSWWREMRGENPIPT
ncbi:hypothetical protein GQ53DRAFT_708108 [Thozetella sp. PMI_491]|nr:hypothetical protein GQ53DRAFT_708108 [Thozetella sp. PMI_491]